MERIVRNATDMLAWIAPDGKFYAASRPLLARWQLDEEVLSQKSLADLVHAAEGDGFTRHELLKLFRRGGSTELPVVCEAVAGCQEKAQMSLVPQFDPFGVEQGLLCQFVFAANQSRRATDSKLHLSDSFFKTVLNSISDAVLILDAATLQVLAVNTVFLTESGQREEEVIGKSCQSVAHGGTFAFMLTSGICPLLETVSQERTAVAEHVYREDGKPIRVFEISTSPIFDASGKVAQVVHVSRDVTARRRFEEEVRGLARRLAQSNEDLQQANEDMKHFAYIVSHDMRAPLVSIKGFSVELRTALRSLRQFLATQPELSAEARAFLENLIERDFIESIDFISSSASRLDGMISAILQLARLGYREFSPEIIDVEELVRGIFTSLAHQLEQKHVAVKLMNLPVVTADRVALGQILGNLIDNAVKYLEPGRAGQIEVSAERTADQLVFQVKDNGRGISARDLEKVFDLFKRVGRQDATGEGMGLAYVKALVRRFGGQIKCSSVEGEGTAFSFTLPGEMLKIDSGTAAGE